MGDSQVQAVSLATATLEREDAINARNKVGVEQPELESLFKDSPYRVDIKEKNGVRWFVWQRLIEDKDKKKEAGPPVWLAPVDIEETGAQGIPKLSAIYKDRLFIPYVANTIGFTDIVQLGADLQVADAGVNAPQVRYTKYIIIPKDPWAIFDGNGCTDIKMDRGFYENWTGEKIDPNSVEVLRFVTQGLSIRAEDDVNGDLLGILHTEKNGNIYPNIFTGLKIVGSFVPPKEKPEEKPLVVYFLDTSGSMGMFDRGNVNRALIKRSFIEARDYYRADMRSWSENPPKDLFFRLIAGNKSFDYIFSREELLEDVASRVFENFINGINIVFEGDEEPFSYPKLTDASNTSRVLEPMIVDPSSIMNDPVLFAEDRNKFLEIALREKLPLFVTMNLFSVDSGETGTLESHVFERLSKLSEVIPKPELLREVEGMIFTKQYDEHVQKRAIALLYTWAIRGSDDAKKTLVGVFENFAAFPDSEVIDPSVGVFLGKAVSIFLTEDDATRVFEAVKNEPDSPKNTIRLASLAGHAPFGKAVGFLYRRWSSHIQRNEHYGNLNDSLAQIFADPITESYKRSSSITEDQARLLAGIKWSDTAFHETLNELSNVRLDVFRNKTTQLVAHLSNYAIAYFRPNWFEGKDVTINPIPTKRYYYEKTMNEVEKEIFKINMDGNVTSIFEEAWTFVGELSGKGTLYETGVIATSTSTMTDPWSWKHIVSETMKKEIDDDDLLVVGYHNHPIVGFNLPMHMIAIPSDADLKAFLHEGVRTVQKFPHASIEFRIVSPLGVTVITPEEGFINAIREFSSKEESDFIKFYKEYVWAIENFSKNVFDSEPRSWQDLFNSKFEGLLKIRVEENKPWR